MSYVSELWPICRFLGRNLHPSAGFWASNTHPFWLHIPSMTQYGSALPSSPYMQDYFKRFFVLCSSEVIFLFLIKMLMLKAIEIEIAFFLFPRVARWIISFMLNISVITSPTNWYLYGWVSKNIPEVINENRTSGFNYWDDFSKHGNRR